MQASFKDDHLTPGQHVYINHFVSSTKGCPFTSAGKTADNEMCTGACLFNDHASSFIHVDSQNHLMTHEMLMAKDNFELMCRDDGVIPQSYWSENSKCFSAKDFTESHSAMHWPDVADATIWPMTIAHAVYLHESAA